MAAEIVINFEKGRAIVKTPVPNVEDKVTVSNWLHSIYAAYALQVSLLTCTY